MRRLIIIICLIVFISLHYGCKDNSTEPSNDDRDTTIVVYKPNLYLHPTKEINLYVKLSFPMGGQLLNSIPEYNQGWDVTVDTNGLINKTYRFLFYEYRVPDKHQIKYGWIISKNNLKTFFENNMESSGFNEIEIKDFTDYWIPILNDHNYYEIYPQYKSTLDLMSEIEFSIKPDNFYRLQYLIRGRNDNNIDLLTPKTESAKKEEFYVLEWGVMLK